jgi:hypothetical protein
MLVVLELVVAPLNERNLMVELGPCREGLSLYMCPLCKGTDRG